MSKKQVYLVYREVIASSISDATRQKGKIYQVSLASDEVQLQLIKPKNKIGFTKKQDD